jgi:hypothetical protein
MRSSSSSSNTTIFASIRLFLRLFIQIISHWLVFWNLICMRKSTNIERNKMRRLNLDIRYISDSRNKVANVLFRTLFNENNSEKVEQILKKIRKQESEWVWKDERDEFDEFLTFLNLSQKSEVIDHDTLNEISVFMLNAIAAQISNNSDQTHLTSWDKTYRTSS